MPPKVVVRLKWVNMCEILNTGPGNSVYWLNICCPLLLLISTPSSPPPSSPSSSSSSPSPPPASSPAPPLSQLQCDCQGQEFAVPLVAAIGCLGFSGHISSLRGELVTTGRGCQIFRDLKTLCSDARRNKAGKAWAREGKAGPGAPSAAPFIPNPHSRNQSLQMAFQLLCSRTLRPALSLLLTDSAGPRCCLL